MTSGNSLTITWSSYNKPLTMSKGTNSVSFKYGPDRSRYLKTSNSGNTKTLYLGKSYERTTETTGGNTTVLHKQMIYAEGGVVASHELKEDALGALIAGSTKTLYMHADPLGSIDTVTDGAGNPVDRMSFDPFGKINGVRLECR